MPKVEIIGIRELAVILHKSEASISADVTRAPHRLPPRIVIPGSRKVLWRLSTVEQWLKLLEQPS